jgi:hypothetical protein
MHKAFLFCFLLVSANAITAGTVATIKAQTYTVADGPSTINNPAVVDCSAVPYALGSCTMASLTQSVGVSPEVAAYNAMALASIMDGTLHAAAKVSGFGITAPDQSSFSTYAVTSHGYA